MKKVSIKILMLFTLACPFIACSDDEETFVEKEVVLHPVDKLYEPEENQEVALSVTSSKPVVQFGWKKSELEGSTAAIKYEVLFDRPGGDFSNPLKRIPSEKMGAMTNVAITHIELDNIASLAGIKEGEQGSLIWTIASKSGDRAASSSLRRTLKVTRSFVTYRVPAQLFLTGSATETGTLLADALEFSKVSSDVFEIFTRLNAGAAFKLIDTKDESQLKHYYIKGELFQIGDQESTVSRTGVYRIRIDVTRQKVTLEEVKSLRLFFCTTNGETADLAYEGKGIFSGITYIAFGRESWGVEERYKFQMKCVKEGGSTPIISHWGTKIETDSRPTGQPSYFYIKDTQRVDTWGDKWKFAGDLDRTNVRLTVTLSGSNYTHQFEKVTLEDKFWQKAADESSTSFLKGFWNAAGHFNNDTNGSVGQYDYWPEAHAIDVIIDAYLRTKGDAARKTDNDLYRQRIYDFHDGVKKKNGGRFYNNYYDDMAWHGITHLRALEAIDDKRYEASAKDLWIWLTDGWNDFDGGGIPWNHDNTEAGKSKGVPSNGPSAIIGVRRWMKYGDSEIVRGENDLQWAKKIYQWMRDHRYEPETGRVFEHKNDKNGDWTYNAGTFMGAGMDIYDATGERMYFDDAIRTADYALANLINSKLWVLRDWAEQPDHDVNLFKAIFVRYFTRLIMHKDLPVDKRANYIQFMKHNAQVLWHSGSLKQTHRLYNFAWYFLPEKTVLRTQISGCAMIEAIAQLEKAGYLQ